MKISLIAVFLLISLKTLAQSDKLDILPVDSLTHKITYSEWVKVEGAKADELYSRTVSWFSKKNDSIENVFPIVKGNGNIRSKGYTWLTIKSPDGMKLNPRELTRELFYTITVIVKDGGYRFTMSDFYFHYFANGIFSADRDSVLESVADRNPHDILTNRFLYQVGETAKESSESLKAAMKPSAAKEVPKEPAPNIEFQIRASGDELIRAANQYYTGLGLTIGGVLITDFGITALSHTGSFSALPIVELVGALLVVVGTIEMLASYDHIKKAGRLLKYGNKYELGFSVSHSGGIGLCLTF